MNTNTNLIWSIVGILLIVVLILILLGERGVAR
jgi:hypothetical protein